MLLMWLEGSYDRLRRRIGSRRIVGMFSIDMEVKVISENDSTRKCRDLFARRYAQIGRPTASDVTGHARPVVRSVHIVSSLVNALENDGSCKMN